MITCTKCNETKPENEFVVDKRKRSGKQSQCRACDRKRTKKHYRKTRSSIFSKLGGSICNICGFSDVRALQIDHIYGGGHQQVKKFKSSISLYNYLVLLPADELCESYQVLCANCNCIKRIENKEHGNSVK